MYFGNKDRNLLFKNMESLFKCVEGLFSLIIVKIIIRALIVYEDILLPLLDLWVSSRLTRRILIILFTDKALNTVFCVLDADSQFFGLFRLLL